MESLAKIFCWFTKRAEPILSIVKLCVQPYHFSLISLWLCVCQLSNPAIFCEISWAILNDDVLFTKMTRNHWWSKEFRRNIYLSRRFLLRFYNRFLGKKVLYIPIFTRVTIQALGQALCQRNNFINICKIDRYLIATKFSKAQTMYTYLGNTRTKAMWFDNMDISARDAYY